MKNYVVKKIGDVCKLVTGGTPSRNHPEYFGGEIKWLVSGDINKKEIFDCEGRITDLGLKNSNTRILPENCLLIALNGQGKTRGTVAILRTEATCNQSLVAIIPDSSLLIEFLYHNLNSRYEEIRNLTGETDRRGLNMKIIKDIKIPIPSLKEQKEIIKVLSQANSLRQKRMQTFYLLDQYLRSTFLNIFGDPELNPHNYRTDKLKHLISDIQAGWSAQSENRKAEAGEVGVLKISAVTSGTFRPSENKYVKSVTGKKLIKPEKGDLLFSRANTRELVAATCVVDTTYDNLFLPDKLWKITPKNDRSNVWFLHYLISYDRFRDILRSKATGTSGSMLNISQQKFLETTCYVPPIESQAEFANIISKTEDLKQQMLKQSEGLEKHFQSLVQKTFN